MNDNKLQLSPAALEVCSTENLGAKEWRDWVCGMIPGASFDWLDGPPRLALAGIGPFANAQIIEFANDSPVRAVGKGSSATSGCDSYFLTLLLTGCARSRHAGCEALWQPGDLVLFDRAQPFDVVHPTDYHLLVWQLPRETLAPMLAAPDRSIGQRIPGSAGPGAVLGNYVRALVQQAARLDASTQHSMLMHLCGLVGLTLGASPSACESRRETHRAVRRQQILTYIETHLRDPRLTAQRAAVDLRISPRWLHALLEDGEIRFTDWVARRRLEECKKLLCNPAHDHLSVAEIAFQSGFGDLSTFNRRFRAQYGMAPRDARRLRAECGHIQRGMHGLTP